MNELRAKIIEEAESYIGTPFHHEARVKGCGVDCGTFLVGVYESLNLVPHFTLEHYSKDFMMHNDREWYAELLLQFSEEITGDPQPGDVVLYKHGRIYSHGGLVTGWPLFIHASTADGYVCPADASKSPWSEKPKRYFRHKIFIEGGE